MGQISNLKFGQTSNLKFRQTSNLKFDCRSLVCVSSRYRQSRPAARPVRHTSQARGGRVREVGPAHIYILCPSPCAGNSALDAALLLLYSFHCVYIVLFLIILLIILNLFIPELISTQHNFQAQNS